MIRACIHTIEPNLAFLDLGEQINRDVCFDLVGVGPVHQIWSSMSVETLPSVNYACAC